MASAAQINYTRRLVGDDKEPFALKDEEIGLEFDITDENPYAAAANLLDRVQLRSGRDAGQAWKNRTDRLRELGRLFAGQRPFVSDGEDSTDFGVVPVPDYTAEASEIEGLLLDDVLIVANKNRL